MAEQSQSESVLVERARRHWDADGISILIGAAVYLGFISCAWLILTGAGYIGGPNRSWFVESLLKPVLAFALITSPFWGIATLIYISENWESIVEWFKSRVTYRRAGYVAPPSYWPDAESVANASFKNRPTLCRWLDFIGGFWFLPLLAVFTPNQWHLSWSLRLGTLFCLLAVRGIRFAAYPDVPDSPDEPKLQRFSRLVRKVTNSFWVWVLFFGLLPLSLGTSNPLQKAVSVAALLIVAWIFYKSKLVAIQSLGFALVTTVLASIWIRDANVLIPVSLVVPGLYGAAIGLFRLLRFLRANPPREV